MLTLCTFKTEPELHRSIPRFQFVFRVPNTPVSQFLILDVSRQNCTGLPQQIICRGSPVQFWRETSKIKNWEAGVLGTRKTNWNREMLLCNSGSVLKMITRSETSTNQSGSAMNRSGPLRTYYVPFPMSCPTLVYHSSSFISARTKSLHGKKLHSRVYVPPWTHFPLCFPTNRLIAYRSSELDITVYCHHSMYSNPAFQSLFCINCTCTLSHVPWIVRNPLYWAGREGLLYLALHSSCNSHFPSQCTIACEMGNSL